VRLITARHWEAYLRLNNLIQKTKKNTSFHTKSLVQVLWSQNVESVRVHSDLAACSIGWIRKRVEENPKPILSRKCSPTSQGLEQLKPQH